MAFQNLRFVCLAASEWDSAWQPSQEIMLRLARAGNPVLYIDPTGTRSIRLHDWPRVIGRFRTRFTGPRQAAPLPDTLRIFAPFVIPYPHSRLARGLNLSVLLRGIRNWLGREIGPDVVIWVCFPSRLNLDLIRKADGALRVYQIMSSAKAASPHSQIIEANEALLKECDLIFANGRRLWDQARSVNSRAYLMRAGVNLDVFQTEAAAADRMPEDLRGIPRPLVGYAGSIHRWIDFEMLANVAKAMPDCSFVMVGPIVSSVGGLKEQPNVHWLGQKSHGEVPAYVRQFDVCLVPYVRDEYMETAFPGKLNEYLALGKPVVATPLPELEDFNREFENVLYLANDTASFEAVVRKALSERSPFLQERYRRVALSNSWSAKVEEMSRSIQEVLSSKLRGHESQGTSLLT